MPDKKPRRIKRSASAITRIFGHFMSIEGNAGYKEGTWIVGLLFLESAPELSALKKVFTERLLKMYRFKSRLVTSKYGGYWEEIFDEEFDWKYHLNVALENEKPTLERAQEFIGNIYEQGFDINKPLWRFFLVPEMENGKALLITMFNHAIGDGVASVGVLLQMLDDPPMDPNLPAHLQKNFIPAKRSKKPNVPLLSRIGMFFFGIKEGLLGPLGYIDPVNALKPIQDVRPRGFEKVLALSEQVPIEKFKEIKNKFEGATINDILLTVLSMTMKAYMIEIDDPSLKRKTLFGGQASPLRGNFPVSLRNPKKPILTNGSPNNEWNSISFRFPYNYTSGVDAVFKVKEQLDKDKVSPQVWVSKWNATFVLRTLPRKFVSNILLRYNARVTAMLSNVPGPMSEVHIAGKAIKDLMFFLFSPLNVYLGLITYNGKVSLGINFSKNLERDPNQFAKHWTEQFNLLYDEVMSYDGVIPKDPKKRKKKEMVSV